ncbi:DUF805 domain-containing protein [Acinetobacter sp. ANC 3781]|jgi:uncharacterized membrane protein YhaH (DUF805 family)|uniref:DUF805 domain-containing protein n=1 Tax=Acinetobacter sp. ANC 3781 TaxID=2529835 RepID=UPI00103DBE20|nr:DUF805 domain-containing protein [Acinetobacter sp. ANC 3781]TCB75926.1 DUF805 domain-containing protein [Acinetobacter sp. ANC 3781]
MNPQDSSPFFSRPPLPTNDNPLSPQGRFGRLSSIGWYGFVHLITFFATLALSLTMGIFHLNTLSVDNQFVNTLTGLAGLGFVVILVLYLYFLMVISIRRLHDMNRSGWLILLFLIPLLNIFMGLYLLLGSGSKGVNNYGLPRATPVWEKILAWLMIIITVLSFMASSSIVSYMFGAGELEMPQPQEVIQKGTAYF